MGAIFVSLCFVLINGAPGAAATQDPGPRLLENRQSRPPAEQMAANGSMRNKFAIARRAPTELFARLNPDDESFLVTVSDRPTLKQNFTSNLGDIENALVFTSPRGSTSLLDGIYLGLQHLKKPHNPRRALIVVSDRDPHDFRKGRRHAAQPIRAWLLSARRCALGQIPKDQGAVTASERHSETAPLRP